MKKTILFFVLMLAAFSCKKETTQEDLCEGVVCKNGGTCVNGDCSCPPGYTGPDCGQEKVPVKMRISSVTLNGFPQTDNGVSWDVFNDGPDVYIQIKSGSTVIFQSGWVQDLQSAHTFDGIVEFSNPQATYTISVFDYDDGLSADDYMGGINFTPYKPGQNFPLSINLQCAGCVVYFTLNGVDYTH